MLIKSFLYLLKTIVNIPIQSLSVTIITQSSHPAERHVSLIHDLGPAVVKAARIVTSVFNQPANRLPARASRLTESLFAGYFLTVWRIKEINPLGPGNRFLVYHWRFSRSVYLCIAHIEWSQLFLICSVFILLVVLPYTWKLPPLSGHYIKVKSC